MWKNQAVEDEIPLTHTTPNITQETRAKFDSLLLAALEQEKQQRQQKNADESKLQCQDRPTGKQKQASRKNRRNNTENSPSASDNGSQQSRNNGKDEELALKQCGLQKLYEDDGDLFTKDGKVLVLNKRLKNEKNESKVSNVKQAHLVNEKNDTQNGNKIDETEARSGSSTSLHENVNKLSITDKPKRLKQKSKIRKPVPLPRQKSLTEAGASEGNNEDKAENSVKEPLEDDNIAIHSELCLINNEQLIFSSRALDDELSKSERKKKKKSKNKNEDDRNEIELQEIKQTGSPFEKRNKSRGSKSKSKERSTETQRRAALVLEKPSAAVNKIIGIHVHRSDFLAVDPLVRHPVIKVHLLDGATGNYLKKSSAQRPASFFYENEDLDYILPLMTEAFEYKTQKSLLPQWDELLIFNEDFQYILKDDPNVLIIFEILDFVSFDIASSHYRKLGAEGGWHKIAWAFLKPKGANGILNVDTQVRLQLYKPQKSNKKNSEECDVYQWWICGEWKKYPATLYVTVKGISPPEQMSPVLRSRSVLQGELSENMQLDLEQEEGYNEKEGLKSDKERSLAASLLAKVLQPNNAHQWSRLPLQSCKIPNTHKLLLPTASKGCFLLQFSNNGYLLACATVGEEKFNIIVYTIPEGKLFTTLCGHLGLVYDLSWSSTDIMLISASADCTVCLWNMEEPTSQAMQMLPHPSFVYSALFHPGNSSILATGCCDHVVRIWSSSRKSLHYELMQELEGHSGFINAITISILTHAMYTADSKGGIIEWTTTKVKPKRLQMQWKLNRKIDLREIKETVVNRLLLHPQGKRLLIHVRDSRLRMLDIATGAVIQWYSGALNHRFQTYACISPCGGLVIAGSEDGSVYVWQTDTGEQLAVYSGLCFQGGVNTVHYHPYEHLAAFGSYGSPAHVIICGFDSKSSGKDIGLQIMSHKDNVEDKKLASQTLQTSHSKLHLSPTQRVSGASKHISKVLTDSKLMTEEASSICSTYASTVNLTSILERMDEFLKKSSPSSNRASESSMYVGTTNNDVNSCQKRY